MYDLTYNQVDALVENLSLSRSQMSHRFLDPHGSRDIDDECHYPKTASLTPDHYRAFYDREPVATRVVQLMPSECWRVQPTVYEDEDTGTQTEFERAWDALGGQLRGGWYKSEADNPLWEYLRRVDVLSGIGHFGILLLGIDDGRELREPLDVGNGPRRRLLYLRAYDESLVDIPRCESNIYSPRYGQPVTYNITLNDPTDQHAGVGLGTQTVQVHWSRVIHVADNLGSSEVFGVPRMRPVLNRLYDLQKLYGGSAEMHWQGAFPGLSFETHPQLGGDVRIDPNQMAAQVERLRNTLQRTFAVEGVSVKSLSPQFEDPSKLIDTHLTAICIQLGVPKRIFLGSERGELASSQDARAWQYRLNERRHNYITPRLIIPLVDRLIQVGVLPQPKRYRVSWPEPDTLQPLEQAQLSQVIVQTVVEYISGGADAIFDPMDLLVRVLHFDEEDARTILETAMEHIGPAAVDAPTG